MMCIENHIDDVYRGYMEYVTKRLQTLGVGTLL